MAKIFCDVTHVLFDMDGLILNTEDLYTEAFKNILKPYGKTYTVEFKQTLMGLQSRETAERMILEYQLPLTVEQFLEISEEQFKHLFPNSELLPGVQRLIEHFHKHQVPMGLATSSSEESYKLKVSKRHEKLFSLLPYKTFGSSDPRVKKGKPSPDIFLVALSKFPNKPIPAECLVFEDALNGVKAAKAAGMQVVMVPDRRLPQNFTDEATLIIDSLKDFEPELFGLPPFDV